ncbi:MAG: gephyrin-like molybdotransferase Glp [Candidatus Nanopelagicales bacterium]
MRSVEEHQRIVLAEANPLTGQQVPLLAADGLVLAEAVAATWPLPSFDNSSMDGYAVRAVDLGGATDAAPVRLPVHGDLAAGQEAQARLEPGTAIRIMTGAPIPDGADAVVPVEWTDGATDVVTVTRAPDLGAHVRRCAEDVAAGEVVLDSGTPINARVIAMLAAVGLADIPVHRRPRVAVISTGDELVDPGVPPGPGQIVDSNSYMLTAAVREAGAEGVRIGPVPDDEATLERILREEAEKSDLILTSGGVSMGAYDTVKAVLSRMGGVDFVKVAMQPGMPQGSGRVGTTPIITLPGNPVSSFVSFEVFVRPVIRRMLGFEFLDRPILHAICAREFTSPPGKTQFARVRTHTHDGLLMAEPEGGQGSHIIGGLARADGLAVVPVGVDRVRERDELVVWDLRGDRA